jgi:hypothetical protein
MHRHLCPCSQVDDGDTKSETTEADISRNQ